MNVLNNLGLPVDRLHDIFLVLLHLCLYLALQYLLHVLHLGILDLELLLRIGHDHILHVLHLALCLLLQCGESGPRVCFQLLELLH